MPTLQQALDTFARPGRLEWIGRAPERRAPLEVVDEARVDEGTGLRGEHHARSGRGHRQVTLIQQEHLEAIRSLAGLDAIEPGMLRRNLVVSGINLVSLKGRRFSVGEVVLEHTGPCDPCTRMERNLGPGGLNAVRGHGGITARVVRGGTIRVGDAVEALPPEVHDG